MDITGIAITMVAVVGSIGIVCVFLTRTDRARAVVAAANAFLAENGALLKERSPRMYDAIVETMAAIVDVEKVSLKSFIRLASSLVTLLSEARKIIEDR